jgi:hypothetical protein
MGTTASIWYFTATPTAKAAVLIRRSLSRFVFSHIKKKNKDTKKKNISMVSIIAIRESQTIPGITPNKTEETNAVLDPYIFRAISKTTTTENNEKVTATNLAANTLAPPNKKKPAVTKSNIGG